MNILVYSPVSLGESFSGSRARIRQVGEALRLLGHTVFLADGSGQPSNPVSIKEPWARTFRLKATGKMRAGQLNPVFDSWYSEGLGEELASMARSLNIHAIVFNYVFHTKALEFLPPDILKIVDTHDVFSNRRLSKDCDRRIGTRIASKGFFNPSREDERKYLSRADLVLAITKTDQDDLRALLPGCDIYYFPFFVPPFSPARQSALEQKGVTRVGFLGSKNRENIISLARFIRAMKLRPNKKNLFTLHVYGPICAYKHLVLTLSVSIFARKSLVWHGPVPEPTHFYENIDVCLIPTEIGTGASVKFLEALAFGRRLYSTKIGSRGSSSHIARHNFKSVGHLLSSLAGDIRQGLIFSAVEEKQLHEKLLSDHSKAIKSLERRLDNHSRLRQA